MRKLKLFFACLLMAVLSIGQMWAAETSYAIEFKSTANSSDGSQTKTAIADLITDGADYVTSVDATNCYQGKSGYGIKVGKSSGNSSIVLNLSSAGQVKPTKVVINACRFGSDTGNMNVTLNSGSATAKTLTSSLADCECDMDGNTTLTKITIAPTTKRIYVKSITVYYEGGSSDPEVSVDPAALDFGTVEQNAVVAGKTFTLTGSNLTDANAVSITAPTGYTVSPTSVTPSSGAISETVTVTPVTTSTGDFNSDITISSDDLDDDVTVSLTMTVSAPVAVTGVTLDENAISLEIGATQTLTATVAPNDATNKNVTWESDDTNIATVDENGVVTAVAVGSANITCKSAADATKSATCAVTVTVHVVTAGTYDVTLNNALFGSEATGSLSGDALHDYTGQQNDITFNYVKGSGSNMYMNASQIRLYKNITLVVSVPAGFNITEVTGLVANIAANVGSISNNTWTGKSNSITFSFTASSGNAQLGAISVTYEATVPTVTVDPSSLSFDAKQNIAVAGKTFTLTGANLTSGLTLAASAGFTVSPTSLTAEAAMAQGGVEVTVTPATPTTTTTPVEGTVTISGGGLASDVEVALSMAVTPTYAVAIAVNENAMGTATINNGAGPVYAEYAENVTLVATPESGYEFASWSASNNDIEIADATSATTTATIGAAGTITATFQEQACTNLAAPVLDAVTKDYQSATIAWEAVANADGYVLNIKKHEGNVPVVTDELIVAPAVSFEKTGLEANTQYDYTVMAVGDGTSYCDESNPLLEGNFTTNDYPSVIVTYSENGNTDNQVSKKIQTAFALPTEVTNNISGKTFVGWTTKSDFEDGDESDEETYFAKGADFTITSNAAVTLYAVYATAGSGDVTISSTPLTSAPEQGAKYVIGANHKTAGIKYFSTYSGTGSNLSWGTMDASTTIYFTLSGTTSALTAYDGSAYLKNRSGGFEMSTTSTTIALQADGAIRGSSEETATRLRYNSEQDTYGLRWYASDKSTGNPAYFYKVEQNTSYSDYVISGSAALPVLDAPTFPVAEGVFYESTDITISAATGASIYYTTDGTTPSSTNGTLYEGAITLNAYGTYNFKAIAVQAGHEDSEVAEATYYFGMTFASVSDLYTYLETNSLTSLNNVKVTGLVSRITTAWDGTKGYLTYYISDNGVAENDLQMYRGAGEGASALAVGDQVTVTGNYTLFQSTTHEFGAGNTIVARTAGAHDSYEIAGNLGKTNFAAGEKWLDSYLSGLSVNDVYNTGYKAAVSDVSFSADKTDQTALESTDTQITVTATKDQAELAMKDFAITVSSATLVSIALKDGYKTEYYVGDELVKPTVIATLSDYSQIEETATACTGQNMSVAGVYTVNVAFTYGDNTIDEGVEYQITVKAIYNNDDAPHTVAEALDIIGQHHNTTTASSDSIVVAGIVSRLDGSNVNTYWISDDGQTNNELEVYRGTYLGKVSFTTNNQLQVGDEVVVKGKVKTYSNTKEFDTGSRLVSLARTPNFEVADVAEALEINISEDLGVEDLTITKEGEGAVTLVSSDETKVSIVNGKLHAVAAAENVEITANLAANGIYKANSDVFHVSVIAERTRYAVTFDPDGGTGTDPVIADQLAGATVELPENPYSKANNAFAGWVVNDGAVTITDGHFTMPAAAVTIKATWNIVATCAISFRVNGEEVTTANAPQTAAYTLTQVGATVPGFTFLGWSETEYADEVENAPEMITSYTPEAGESTKVLYGIYKREQVEDHGHYVLNYTADVADKTLAYGSAVEVTATDGSEWIVKAYKSNGMQINTSKNASIKIPNCPGKIFSIAITTSTTKSVGLSASDYSGSGAITYIASGTDATSQTLDLSGETVTAGYIVPKGGNAIITNIDVEFDASKTYYTSSPVEKVTITFDANGGNGGCAKAIINKGGKLTICDEAPTRLQKEFAGWNSAAEGDGTAYDAGSEYTFNADVTLYAQWAAASTYAVTYDVNGSDATAPTQDAQYAGDQFTVAAAIARGGFTFQGWLYNNKLYAAGASFTMPAKAVTFVAQWRKQSQITTYNMSLITDASALSDGMQIALGCGFVKDEQSYFAMAGDLGSNKYMASVTDNVSISDGVATYTSAVLVMTLEQFENGWKITKDGTNYLTSTGNSDDDLKWDSQANATVWTISFSGNNVYITNSSSKRIQYNSGSPRFKPYGGTQKDIQLFGKAVVVENNTSVSDLGYVEEEVIVVPSNTQFTVDVEITTPVVAKAGATIIVEEDAEHLVVEQGGKVEVTENANTDIFRIQTAPAQQDNSNSGQLVTVQTDPNDPTTIKQLTIETLYMDVQLVPSVLQAGYWYSIAAPFDVSLTDGFYLTDGTPLVYNQHIQVWIFNPLQFANGGRAWSRCSDGIMQKNQAHLIGFDPNAFGGEANLPNVIRLKVNNVTIGASTGSLELSQYSGSTGSYNWNGVANPNTHYVSVDRDGQYYDNIAHNFDTYDKDEDNFVVGSPIFCEASSAGDEITISSASSATLAPARVEENRYSFRLRILKQGARFYDNQMIIRASESALPTFEQGKDMVTLNETCNGSAILWTNAYGKRLAIEEAPLQNNQAIYDLSIMTPAAGTYVLRQANEVEGATLYVTYNGAIVWNLSLGDYELDLTRGTTTGYGLLLVAQPNQMPTGLDTTEGVSGDAVQKILLNGQLYILRDGHLFDAVGHEMK